MELISREEIMTLTNIGESQFKSFRRLGLIDGFVKKTSVVKLDEKRTEETGKEVFAPAGFTYLYPRSVLTQIKWINVLRGQGKNLMEIQGEYIRKKIQEEEEMKRHARTYEKMFTVPAGSPGEKEIMQKFVKNAVRELTEQIRKDNPDRQINSLVFFLEPEKYPSAGSFVTTMTVRLDVENSKF